MRELKSLFITITVVLAYLFCGIASLLISGAMIWVSLFLFGWFLGVVGVL